MNKKIKIAILVFIVLIVLITRIPNVNANLKEKNFLSANKTEIAAGETLEIKFDLSAIEYTEFKIILNSNVNIDDIYTDEETEDLITDDEIIEEETNAIMLEINKDKLNLDYITMYYNIPEDIELGAKIELVSDIIVEKEENSESEESEDTSDLVEEIVKTETIEITIIENTTEEDSKTDIEADSKEENNPNINENIGSNVNQNENTLENSANEENNFSQMESTKGQSNTSSVGENQNFASVSISSGNISYTESKTSTTTTAVYNGSDNNYLSSLDIEGISLNTTFSKEITTYFAEIENYTTANITAIAEDENAKVCITGEDTLVNGQNKILITVTAENGDVRYYRIFIENTLEETTEE